MHTIRQRNILSHRLQATDRTSRAILRLQANNKLQQAKIAPQERRTPIPAIKYFDSGYTRWYGRKIEADLKEEEGEIDPLEEVDLDPRKEKEDPMSPRRELLWQTIYITLAQPEMQVTILRLQTSLSTTSKENISMLVI